MDREKERKRIANEQKKDNYPFPIPFASLFLSFCYPPIIIIFLSFCDPILFLSLFYPFLIRFLYFCAPILFLSFSYRFPILLRSHPFTVLSRFSDLVTSISNLNPPLYHIILESFICDLKKSYLFLFTGVFVMFAIPSGCTCFGRRAQSESEPPPLLSSGSTQIFIQKKRRITFLRVCFTFLSFYTFILHLINLKGWMISRVH